MAENNEGVSVDDVMLTVDEEELNALLDGVAPDNLKDLIREFRTQLGETEARAEREETLHDGNSRQRVHTMVE